MAESINLKCPSFGQILAAADERGLVNVLRVHLYEEHALEMLPERVKENVAAQLRDFDGYNARPISGVRRGTPPRATSRRTRGPSRIPIERISHYVRS